VFQYSSSELGIRDGIITGRRELARTKAATGFEDFKAVLSHRNRADPHNAHSCNERESCSKIACLHNPFIDGRMLFANARSGESKIESGAQRSACPRPSPLFGREGNSMKSSSMQLRSPKPAK
jgi:hypothetical protein